MGTRENDKSHDSESKYSLSEKRAARQAAKREENATRIDDFFENNSIRGEDYLNLLKEANPSLSPLQINPLIKEAFVKAYSEASTGPQKKDAIETFVLTTIALYRITDPEVIRTTITQMEKGIRTIRFAKAKVYAKKLVVPAIEVGLAILIKKAPRGSSLSKYAKNAAVAVPMIKVAVGEKGAKPEAEAQQDELQAHRLIERVRAILGKLPKTWEQSS